VSSFASILPPSEKPILCLDFNGVIHDHRGKWKGPEHVNGPVIPGALEFLSDAVKHFTVCIFSGSSLQPWGISAMQEWLRNAFLSSGMDIARMNEVLEAIQFPAEKPPSFVSIDDRALTFTGTWPSIESLKAFKPWNRK